MKCHCEQGLDNKVKRLCEHHQRYFDYLDELNACEMARLRAENDILRGMIEVQKMLESVKWLAPSTSVKKVKK